MRRGARAADAIRLFALHSRKGAGDTQGNSSCRRTSGGAAGEARRRPLKPACARLCALTSARVGDAARVLPPVTVRRLSPAVRGVRPAQAPCRCAARCAACRPGAAALMRRLLATRHSPSAKRQAPSAKRQAPSAKRQAPSADRTSIVVIRSLRRACAASPPPSARRLPATQRSGRALCDGRAATRVAPVARLRVLPNLVDSESAQAT